MEATRAKPKTGLQTLFSPHINGLLKMSVGVENSSENQPIHPRSRILNTSHLPCFSEQNKALSNNFRNTKTSFRIGVRRGNSLVDAYEFKLSQEEQISKITRIRKASKGVYFFEHVFSDSSDSPFNFRWLFEELKTVRGSLGVTKSKLGIPRCPSPIAPRSKSHAIVFELEDTFTRTIKGDVISADFRFMLSSTQGPVCKSTFLRPSAKEVLTRLARSFDLYIFTTSSQESADRVLNFLDPFGTFFSMRLYRQHCHINRKTNRFIKLPETVQRPINELLFVDTALSSIQNYKESAVPLIPYLGNPEDRQLLELEAILYKAATEPNINDFLREQFHLEALSRVETEIQLIDKIHNRICIWPAMKKSLDRAHRKNIFLQISKT